MTLLLEFGDVMCSWWRSPLCEVRILFTCFCPKATAFARCKYRQHALLELSSWNLRFRTWNPRELDHHLGPITVMRRGRSMICEYQIEIAGFVAWHLFQRAEYTRHAVHALHHLRLLKHSRQLVKDLPIPQCGSMIRSAWNEAGQFPHSSVWGIFLQVAVSVRKHTGTYPFL